MAVVYYLLLYSSTTLLLLWWLAAAYYSTYLLLPPPTTLPTIVVAGCCLLLYPLVNISCLFSNFVAFAMMNFFKLLKTCAEAVAYAMMWNFLCWGSGYDDEMSPYLWAAKLGWLVYQCCCFLAGSCWFVWTSPTTTTLLLSSLTTSMFVSSCSFFWQATFWLFLPSAAAPLVICREWAPTLLLC